MSTKTSHTVTVTTTSTMPSLAINIPALKTPSVCLKILQTIFGTIAFGLAMTEVKDEDRDEKLALRFQALVILAFLLVTFLLLISSLVSSMAANMIPKTIFEFLYHISGCISYLVVTMVYTLHYYSLKVYNRGDESIGISVLGVANGMLYGVSTYISFKSYRAS